MKDYERVRRILVVAGSDSSSGAGMQADCAAARSQGVFPLCAVSCITSQNSRGLRLIQPSSLEIFDDQLEGALSDSPPDAVKIGMLPSESHIRRLISFLKARKLRNVVLDPVMAPTAGSVEFCREMWRNPRLLAEIAPFVELLTPNIPEAKASLCASKIISGEPADTIDLKFQYDLAAHMIDVYGFKAILMKGGHSGNSEFLSDILLTSGGDCMEFRSHRVESNNTHGTGCALSSLIASRLALGDSLPDAVGQAHAILHESLERNSRTIFYADPLSHNGPAFFP